MHVRSSTITLSAPSKINLALKVRRRRPDGYHELDSFFLPLDFADTLTLRLEAAASREISLHCPGRPELDGATNLAYRAATAFLDASAAPALALQIRLDKRIWTAAGLGGGSSDAAAVLRGLAALLPEYAPTPKALAGLALGLGADVPFFLFGQPAHAGGVGERLKALHGVPELAVLLVNPGLPLLTKDVFAQLGLSPDYETPAPLWPIDFGGDLRRICGLVSNDLGPAARSLCPAIGTIEALLAASGAMAYGLSGSGPTLFGLYESRAAALAQAVEIRRHHPYLCETARSLSGLTPISGSLI